MSTGMLQNFVDFWWSLPIASLLFLLMYFFTHPDKIAIWSSLIAALFEKLSKRSARHSVSSDIQGKISSYIKNNDAGKILPYGLKFKWIKGDDFSSYVEEEDVIVIMDYHNNNARNFVNAVNQYVSKAFLPTVRHELPPEILAAAELTMQEKIIQNKRPDALDIFQDEVLPAHTTNRDVVKANHTRFKELDILGYFDNIFLTEVVFAGQRLQGMGLDQKIKEIQEFLVFLQNIENEETPLIYHGDVFRVNVILVAKLITRGLYGIAPYLKRAKEASSQNANSLYVTGREKNIGFVDDVVNKIKEESIGKLEWVRSYTTRDRERNKKNAKMALFRL